MQRSIGLRTGILILALAGLLAYVVSAATTYADPGGRFTFTVPDGYIQRYRAGTDVSFRSVTTQTSTVDVTVIAQAPDVIPSADTIAMNTLKGLTPPAYTPGTAGIQPTLLGGQPARKVDYYTKLDGVPTRTHTLQIIAATAKAAYLLVFSAADTDYNQMLSDTAIIPGSFSFGSLTGAGSATTGSSVAISAPSTVPPVSTTTVASLTATASFPTTGPTIPPEFAPPPPILPPMSGPTPVFMIATPTPVIAGSFAGGSSVTADTPAPGVGKGPGYGSGFPSQGAYSTRDPSTDRN